MNLSPALHLALDCSAARPTVAVMRGEQALAEWLGPGELKHHETLLAGIHECLSKAGSTLPDLNYLSVGVGPGMFTGLRIAVITAKFIADPLNLRCVPVSSLLALGWQSGKVGKGVRVWAVADAKARRVYALPLEEFTSDFSSPASEALALPPEEAAAKMNANDLLIGDGAVLYKEIWPAKLLTTDSHSLLARSIGVLGTRRYALGLTCSATELEPMYLKTGQPHL